MSEESSHTEIPGGLRWRKRVRWIALAVLGLCVICLLVGIGLLGLQGFLVQGILALVLFVVFLLLGMYLNAASRLIHYTDGTTAWEERKKTE